MSYSDKGITEDAEALVETLAIENASLSESNLSSLSHSDFQRLTQLSHELALNSEMETDENEIIVESHEEIEHEEEVVQTEIEPQEIEIETANDEQERNMSPEAITPDKAIKTPTVPPLRPLTIAPKPKQIPIAIKPAGGGQQLLLLQGAGSGQAIKLVSPQGQELNLGNFSLSRPVTIKPAIKTTSHGGNISVVQQKPVVVKKILAPGQKVISKPITFTKQGHQFMVVQKSDNQHQQVKIVQATGSNVTTIPSPTKTITLQQAQEMGLLGNTKIISSGQSMPKQTVLINKTQPKTIKIVPQGSQGLVTSANTKTISINQLKSPTKILPATSGAVSKGPQRIIFKTASSNQTILPPGQLIQVAGTQALNSGQIHQINIPGKGMQYIKFVSSSTNSDTISTTANVVSISKSTSVSSGILSEVKPVSVASKIAPKPLSVKQTTIPTSKINVSGQNMVIVPTNLHIPSHQPQVSKVAIPPMKHNLTPVLKPPIPPQSEPTTSPSAHTDPLPDSNGMRPRKPCNCTKSQCLKLYCDCFANGEFCYLCNCMNCFNNLENEDHRNRAIKACLERNPNAFRPKIGKAKDPTGEVAVRKHTKGCNCKRSGCLKNYCECYEAKIACSSNCKCVGCRNIEDSIEKKNLRLITTHMEKSTNTVPDKIYRKITPYKEEMPVRQRRPSNRKQTISLITDDVIEATCQCLLTISDDADSNMQDDELTKRQIIEEFGRCLTEIINCSSSR